MPIISENLKPRIAVTIGDDRSGDRADDDLPGDVAPEEFRYLGGELCALSARLRGGNSDGEAFGDLRVVEQKEERKNDRRECDEEAGRRVDGDRAERRERRR